MLVDALTKPMWSDTLHKFVTTGYWTTNNVESKPIRLRTMVVQDDYTEHDLVNIDKMENTKEKEKRNEDQSNVVTLVSPLPQHHFKPHFNLANNTYHYYYFNRISSSTPCDIDIDDPFLAC